MKNKLIDLNNHLFEQLERINDDELSKDELEIEIKRSKAIEGLTTNIIENARLALDVEKFKYSSYGQRSADMPEMLKNK